MLLSLQCVRSYLYQPRNVIGGCILKKYMQANHGCQGYFPLFQLRTLLFKIMTMSNILHCYFFLLCARPLFAAPLCKGTVRDRECYADHSHVYVCVFYLSAKQHIFFPFPVLLDRSMLFSFLLALIDASLFNPD